MRSAPRVGKRRTCRLLSMSINCSALQKAVFSGRIPRAIGRRTPEFMSLLRLGARDLLMLTECCGCCLNIRPAELQLADTEEDEIVLAK